MLLEIILFYLGWGVLWSIYCIVSTLIHPFYKKMGLTPVKWVTSTLFSTLLWPYAMYAMLKKSYEEAKKYK